MVQLNANLQYYEYLPYVVSPYGCSPDSSDSFEKCVNIFQISVKYIQISFCNLQVGNHLNTIS